MPNWVTNRIKFSDRTSFDLFRSKYVAETLPENPEKPLIRTFDFNRLIPMPESLAIEEGSRTEDGVSIVLLRMRREGDPDAGRYAQAVAEARRHDGFLFLRRIRETDEILDEKAADYEKRGQLDYVLELGRKAIRNILDYGYPSWYKWALAHWGTKWNASMYRDDPETLEVWFETAWSTPEPVIKLLVESMGAHAFEEIEYADEDLGSNCGYYEFGDGFHAFSIEHANGSYEAMECARRVTGIDPDEPEEDEGETQEGAQA